MYLILWAVHVGAGVGWGDRSGVCGLWHVYRTVFPSGGSVHSHSNVGEFHLLDVCASIVKAPSFIASTLVDFEYTLKFETSWVQVTIELEIPGLGERESL